MRGGQAVSSDGVVQTLPCLASQRLNVIGLQVTTVKENAPNRQQDTGSYCKHFQFLACKASEEEEEDQRQLFCAILNSCQSQHNLWSGSPPFTHSANRPGTEKDPTPLNPTAIFNGCPLSQRLMLSLGL